MTPYSNYYLLKVVVGQDYFPISSNHTYDLNTVQYA
jgi:hypothetical protein